MAGKTHKKNPKRRQLSKRQIAFYVLSVIIILSMTLGFVITMLPGS